MESVLAAPVDFTLSKRRYGKSYYLLESLNHDGFRIDAYTGRALDVPGSANVEIHEIGGRNKLLYYAWAFREVNRALSAGGVDLYHHMNLSYRWFNPVLLAKRGFDVPVVIGPVQTGHEVLPEEFNRLIGHAVGLKPPRSVTDVLYTAIQPVRGAVLDPLRLALFGRTLRLADRIVVVDAAAKAEVARFVDESKVSVVPLGTDVDSFQFRERPDTHDLVAIGNLRERKAYGDLLEALPSVVGEFPEAHLHIFGDGPLEADLKAKTRQLGVAGAVTFHGFVDQPTLREHLGTARAFVHPSISEGFPHVRLEAMASGCPVIVSDIAGADEMVRDGVDGYIVPTRSPPQLADAMSSILGDLSLARRMGANARQQVEERYDWTEIGRQYIEIYESLG